MNLPPGSAPSLPTLCHAIRTFPDWPKPGVQFRDITPLLHHPTLFRALIDAFADRYAGAQIRAIAGIDARGFIIGSALAYRLGTGFILVRKAGKLPGSTLREAYALEYGEAEVEVQTDAISLGERIVVIDDLVATGGTLQAAARLLTALGAVIVEAAAVIDLPALGGSRRLREAGLPFFALCHF